MSWWLSPARQAGTEFDHRTPPNRSLEKIDFAFALAKATMDIKTINYFIAISVRKFTFHNLPFGIVQTLSQNQLLFSIYNLIRH